MLVMRFGSWQLELDKIFHQQLSLCHRNNRNYFLFIIFFIKFKCFFVNFGSNFQSSWFQTDSQFLMLKYPVQFAVKQKLISVCMKI